VLGVMKQQRMMGEQDVVDALKFGKELPQLKDQFQILVEEINSLEDKRNSLRAAISALQNQISAAKDSLKIWQSAVDEKIQNIDEAHKKLAQLENIKNNNKDYQQLEKLAELKANDILANKKAILMTAVIAVLGALRYHPEKQQLLIYDSFYPLNNGAANILHITKMMSSAANPESYLPLQSYHHKEILKIADGLYDQLLKAVIDNTIYLTTPTATTQTNVIKTS
jgi:hypothetical protein